MKSYLVILGLALTAAVIFFLVPRGDRVEVEGDYFYAITSAGVVNGYSVIDTSTTVIDGREVILLEQSAVSLGMLLGMNVDSTVEIVYHIDPETGRFLYHAYDADSGQSRFTGEARVREDGAHCTSSFGHGDKVVALPEGTLLENTLLFGSILEDFRDSDAPDRTYSAFEPGDQAVQRVRYSRAGEEILELAGTEYHTVMVDRNNLETGVKVRLWLDTATGICVKVLENQGRVIYLADPSLADDLERFEVDDYIMTPTNVAIADVSGITYLKVRARIQPTGVIATPENLTVPGQRFTGTVEDNVIEGVFEIEHPRWDGAGAPPFPPEIGGDAALARYLQPSAFIESDDPGIAARAGELTAGAGDSWEAVTRLSDWVATEIGYAIPGGGSARGVYESRAGECGGHSMLLAAFCRAVGIPARVVWGVMYVPGDGGTFGQHGWTEVYMGEAGWLPVDATADQVDFVDSGHIRLGELESFSIRANGKEFEILDYRVAGGGEAASADAADRHVRYLGEYSMEGLAEPAVVEVQDGSLVMVIPGGPSLAFADPDERGRWQCKVARHVYLTFETDGLLNVVEACIHEVHELPRQPGPAGGGDVPASFRPYPGTYRLAAANADFTVSYEGDVLRVHHPLEKTTATLAEPDAEGWRASSNGRHMIRFECDPEGAATAMVIDAASRFVR